MDLSVVVVHWNSVSALQHLLESAEPLLAHGIEFLVVDNASEQSPDTAAWPTVRVLRSNRNLGFAGGANLGIRNTRGAWILLLNPDIELKADSIDRLLDEAGRDPRLAIVTGPLLDRQTGGRQSFQFRRLPSFRTVLSDALFGDELAALLGTRRQKKESSGDRLVEQPAAAYWLLSRTAWKDLDGFDERFYPAWFEDVDFCRRLRDRGWRIGLVNEAPALHRGGVSVGVLGYRRFLRIYYGNLLLYLWKHSRLLWTVLWLPVRLGLAVRLMVAR